MPRRFLDTNIFIYRLAGDHEKHSPRCHALMEQIEAGEIEAVTSVIAVDKALRVLTEGFGYSRLKASQTMSMVLFQPEIEIDHRMAVLDALDFWVSQSSLSFADCYHLALTAGLGMTQIYTFDKKMDRYPGVDRIEP